ncbi:hypothetical protein PFISCL1PPCAC_1865, partial [Pristionchus fissidentatus]
REDTRQRILRIHWRVDRVRGQSVLFSSDVFSRDGCSSSSASSYCRMGVVEYASCLLSLSKHLSLACSRIHEWRLHIWHQHWLQPLWWSTRKQLWTGNGSLWPLRLQWTHGT